MGKDPEKSTFDWAFPLLKQFFLDPNPLILTAEPPCFTNIDPRIWCFSSLSNLFINPICLPKFEDSMESSATQLTMRLSYCMQIITISISWTYVQVSSVYTPGDSSSAMHAFWTFKKKNWRLLKISRSTFSCISRPSSPTCFLVWKGLLVCFAARLKFSWMLSTPVPLSSQSSPQIVTSVSCPSSDLLRSHGLFCCPY